VRIGVRGTLGWLFGVRQKPTRGRHPNVDVFVVARPDSSFSENADAVQSTAERECETCFLAKVLAGVKAAAGMPHRGIRRQAREGPSRRAGGDQLSRPRRVAKTTKQHGSSLLSHVDLSGCTH